MRASSLNDTEPVSDCKLPHTNLGLDDSRRDPYRFGMNNIKELREQRGLSQAKLAELVGTSQPQIRRLELGERELTKSWAERLAPHLGVTAADLLFPRGPNGSEIRPIDRHMVEVPVVGTVEAGAFRVVDTFDDVEPEMLYTISDPRFPSARIIAWSVAGDSMNRLAPRPILPGDRVVGFAYEDIADQVPLRDGMVVVVQRTSAGGHMREWSVKQLEIYEDRVEFHPRSSNPNHKPIIVPRDAFADEGTEVEIIAIVRQIVNNVAIL
jgi:transcriptional regulator with XRE-family HTH domain